MSFLFSSIAFAIGLDEAKQQVEKLAAEKTYKKTSTGNYLWMSGKWAKKEG